MHSTIENSIIELLTDDNKDVRVLKDNVELLKLSTYKPGTHMVLRNDNTTEVISWADVKYQGPYPFDFEHGGSTYEIAHIQVTQFG